MTARRRRLAWSAAGLGTLVPRVVLAHGFGERCDLPVPFWLWTAAATAALSFAIIGPFVTASPGVRGDWRLNLLRLRIGRVLATRRVRFAGARPTILGPEIPGAL